MIKKILLGIFIIIVLFLSYIAYDLIHFKDRMYSISNIEFTISNRYNIGTTKSGRRRICDTKLKYGCLEGEIISYTSVGRKHYIYYKLEEHYYSGDGFLGGDNFTTVLGPYDQVFIKSTDELPQFMKIGNYLGAREVYTISQLEALDDETRGIFEELMREGE